MIGMKRVSTPQQRSSRSARGTVGKIKGTPDSTTRCDAPDGSSATVRRKGVGGGEHELPQFRPTPLQ